MNKYRFSVVVSDDVADLIRDLTPDNGDHSDVLRAGLAILKSVRDRPGMTLGMCADPARLDVAFTNIPANLEPKP
jgi:hypothetical protein